MSKTAAKRARKERAAKKAAQGITNALFLAPSPCRAMGEYFQSGISADPESLEGVTFVSGTVIPKGSQELPQNLQINRPFYRMTGGGIPFNPASSQGFSNLVEFMDDNGRVQGFRIGTRP